MVQVYNKTDGATVMKQKKDFLKTFFLTLTAVVIVNLASFIFYVLQEFNTPYRTPLLIANIVISSVYAIIYYILFSLKYRRIKSYYKMLYYVEHGLKHENANAFVRVDSMVTERDGVEFINLVFLEWSEKKQDYFERYVLFDVEKPLPEFKKGDFVKFITQGNKMIAYELCSNQIFD